MSFIFSEINILMVFPSTFPNRREGGREGEGGRERLLLGVLFLVFGVCPRAGGLEGESGSGSVVRLPPLIYVALT